MLVEQKSEPGVLKKSSDAEKHRTTGVAHAPKISRFCLLAHRSFQRAFQERIEQDGVTIGMWFYLRALWEKDGVTQRELSQSVETMDPSTGSALAKMERLGLIYIPNLAIYAVDPAESDSGYVTAQARGKSQVDGRLTAYVCRERVCSTPLTTFKGIQDELSGW